MIPLLLLVLASAVTGPQDEVQVAASLNRSTAQVGETVLLTVTLRAPGLRSPEIEDPELDAFEILSKADRSTFRFSPTGGAVREFSREYTLRVVEVGRYTIPPIQVTIDGALYETEALHLLVESPGTVGELPGLIGPRPEEEVAVRLWLEPETAYVGQQVTMTVGAFFDPLVRNRLQRQPEYRAPEVLGFWTADLPGTVRPERRVVGGREYFVQIFRRALFPLSPGSVTIPPAAVIYEVRRGLIYAPETFQVESAPVTILVRPLPEVGRPSDFAGAVGRYEAEVWFDRSDLRAGEAVNLVLEIRGSGNLSSLGRPSLPEVPGVRIYEGGEAAEIQLRGVEFAGHKRFSWVLVPERPGRYVLPELRLPYFDPVEASYQVASTEPITLQVETGPATIAFGAAARTTIRFVKPQPGRQPLHLAGRGSFWALQAAPLLLLLGLVILARYRRRAPSTSSTRPQKRRQTLRALRPLAESGDPAFYAELRAAVLRWLEARLHLADLSVQGVVQVQHAVEDAGVPPPVALDIIDFLERCSRLRYAPDPPDASLARELLAKAEKLLALVDQEAVSERRLRTAEGRAGLLFLSAVALSLAWSSAGAAQVDRGAARRWFAEGVSAYGRGDHAAALALFERTLAERPEDPSLLYNLGNSYFELGERGKAAASWVRALRVRPRDGDARFNLRLVVGDDPVIGGALPPLPLSDDELAILLTVFWFTACIALTARRFWRKGYLTFAGWGALALAIGFAVLLLYPRSDYAIVSARESALRAGPVRQSEVLATPAPGLGFRVRERRGDWLRVSRGGESEGWVEGSQVEVIE